MKSSPPHRAIQITNNFDRVRSARADRAAPRCVQSASRARLSPHLAVRSMSARSLARATFRGFLRASRVLDEQLSRTQASQASEVFTEREHEELTEILPRVFERLKGRTVADVAREEYRAASASEEHLSDRLDAALRALRTLRMRLERMRVMAPSPCSDATTRGVRVRVKASLVPAQTAPVMERYVYAYEVEIENENEEAVQVVSRRWRVVDEARFRRRRDDAMTRRRGDPR